MVCPGDSGGPMICYGYQYGIASHGYYIKNSNRKFICGSSDIQIKHLFVYPYIKWISAIIENSNNIGKSIRPLFIELYLSVYTIIVITMQLYIVF